MTKEHTHLLTPGLVSILIKIIIGIQKKDQNCIHLQQDLDLSHNEYANAQKLRYFALIARVKGKSGYWLITNYGGKFLRDEIGIPYRVTTCQNEIVQKSEEQRTIKDFYPAYPNVWFQEKFFTKAFTNQRTLI